jgi:polyisoprenyl-phosphate glycosyltransferase
MRKIERLISIVIPCYNEADNISPFYKSLESSLAEMSYPFEIIFVNDGSQDNTLVNIQKLAKRDKRIKIVSLSRNFGKEIATTAGLHYAKGDAIIMIDGDGQHPPDVIPKFIDHWKKGARIVIGVRSKNQKEGMVKKLGSKLFYAMFNRFTGSRLAPGSTDFRLIDKIVRDEFIKLTERNRITRGLIDWLGFNREFVSFTANPRLSGSATYSFSKLLKLALDSFVSLSLTPLYFSLYLGLFILPLSFLLGLFSVIEMLIGDPLNLHIKGSAYLIILTIFLMGILLVSQGIIAVYLSHIHTETQNRPLFILDRKSSNRLDTEQIQGITKVSD